ncbi:hypothetical protein QQS21_008792 [Conoideocrella luteorostrata]|uniref:Hikeshi-like domain-containing protein n=1 Tax=Conoideocrella luteorostrata TaxID=1105319 RepID=A0AAJ0CI57_9HYPO|nr:hypothetical protein QQS21_008792 [Conoideocrella luteorostrata]
MSGPLFGLVPTGQPLITNPTSTPSPTSFLYTLPIAKSFSHVTVFLLPNITLPENTAAAIYLATIKDVASGAQSGGTPNFRFLGGIGPGKDSALFKITSNSGETDGDGLLIGISIESADSVGQRLQQMSAEKTGNVGSNSNPSQLPVSVLAQRIIQNAFNFLASFSASAGPGGVEVIPLKAFEDWWRKFESRVRADPTFLEKQADYI